MVGAMLNRCADYVIPKEVDDGTVATVDDRGALFSACSCRTRCNIFRTDLYPNRYTQMLKPIRFVGDSLKCLRKFPQSVRQDAGRQLDLVQRGKQPVDFKPMPAIGKGVEEIRLWDDAGTFRVIYMARLADAVYVLHVFQKKSQATSKRDIDVAKARLAILIGGK